MAAAPLLPFSLLFVFFLIFKTHLSLPIADPSRRPSDVHDLLQQYGLPKGLLPNNVRSYTVSAAGDFSIELESPCYVQFDQLVYYDRRIKGTISYGGVHGASGIQAKKLFLWVSVTAMELDTDSGMIEFFGGGLSEKLPAEEFENVPVCKSKAEGFNTLLDNSYLI